jgi:fatty-acyl-CoA synthase
MMSNAHFMGFQGRPERYRSTRLSVSHWPADTSAPLRDLTLSDALREAARGCPERPALIEGLAVGHRGREWNYAELLRDSEAMARSLLEHFAPGERVAVWAPNVPEWVLLLYGCAMAGLVMVTVNPAYKSRELHYVLEKSGASGIFTVDSYRGFDTRGAADAVRSQLPALREVFSMADVAAMVRADASRPLPCVDPSDVCVIMFTSGTTGAQKGVMFHHRGIVNMSAFTQERGGLSVGGVFVNPMPMFHVGALGHAAVGCVMRAATHVLAEQWDPELFMSLVQRHGGSYSLLVPTMIEALLAHPARSRYDVSTLKNLVSGAAVVEASLIRRTFDELGCKICNIYGQTEMQGVVTAVFPDDSTEDQSTTIGQALPHVEIKVADPDSGAVLPLGVTGEICVRGYQTMVGYFAMPQETAGTLRGDGWLHSGDLGVMDARGFLQITGRIKDMIIRGGENIYPREIENLLREQPGIGQVAVVGVPDTYWGEQVGAVIQPQDPARPPDLAELYAFCREQLAGYKAPRLWYLVDEFPWTETGKLQKFKLVESIRAGSLKPVAVY